MMKPNQHSFLILLILILPLVPAQVIGESEYKVLVVMSYEGPKSNPWSREIKEGIDNILQGSAKVDYFYMNTKRDYAGGKLKAREAFELFSNDNYDGVITADDNAQTLFAVPYLKGTTTPVVFCGVNADPAIYEYPATNISGIVERGHFRESIALVKQLAPEIKRIGFIVRESPSGRALKAQVHQESKTYLAEIVSFELVTSLSDIKARSSLNNCDAYLIDSVEGILDGNGKPAQTQKVISFLRTIFKKPVIGANTSHVEQGALCAVVKTGQEQGEGAARKLLQAFEGKSISDIPITRNYQGKRIINVTVMEELEIKPKPITLLGAKLIKTR